MGGQGMMFGNQQTTTTQVSIPKDVRSEKHSIMLFLDRFTNLKLQWGFFAHGALKDFTLVKYV